jgi:hypothetical protein
LDALLNNFSPDARGSCGILGLNVVFDLVQSSSAGPVKKTGSAFIGANVGAEASRRE